LLNFQPRQSKDKEQKQIYIALEGRAPENIVALYSGEGLQNHGKENLRSK